MRKTNFLIAVSFFCLFVLNAQTAADNTYTNPIGGDIRMGDPYVLLYNNMYYLTGTAAGDGVRFWSSPNLRDWKYEGYGFKRDSATWSQTMFWGPEMIHYKGAFYLIYTSTAGKKDTSKGKRYSVCLAKSDKPAGPYKELYAPWFDIGWSCNDSHIFIDDDGTPYLYFDKVGTVGEWPNKYMYGEVYVSKLSADLSKLETQPVLCVKAEQEWEKPLSMLSRCNEGMTVIRHGKKYYMTYCAGHYADPDYAVGYATASSPLGPWVKPADNPLLTKDTTLGVYGPGHNSITWSPDGKEMFIVYHAHVSPKDKNRTVNVDRLIIGKDGKMKVVGPTRSPQPLPSAKNR